MKHIKVNQNVPKFHQSQHNLGKHIEAIEDLAKTLTDQILLLDIGYCEQLEDQEFLSRLMYIIPNCHVVSSFNQS